MIDKQQAASGATSRQGRPQTSQLPQQLEMAAAGGTRTASPAAAAAVAAVLLLY